MGDMQHVVLAAEDFTVGEAEKLSTRETAVSAKTVEQGWQYIDGKWYYYDPANGNALAKGITQIGGKAYLLDPETGAMAVNKSIEIDGKTYTADGWGNVRSGWVQAGGKWYYYENGKPCTGWLEYCGIRYYLDSHGAVLTGEVEAENVNVQMVTCNTDSGDAELEKVLAEDYLQVVTNTGSVDVDNSDAGTVSIETNTGDVTGHFLTPKWFSAFSDTGDVTVPNTPEGGECRIQTDSGDIHFR